jgi:hypothetical protein
MFAIRPPHCRRLAVAFVALLPLVGCAPAALAPARAAPAGAVTLLVRLGTDTLAVEQYTRTAARMDGELVQRSPFTTVAHYSVQTGADGAPMSAEYSLRRGDADSSGALQSLSVRYGADSVTFVSHRASGDSTRTAAARGELLPFVNGSYALFELAIARLKSAKRDSLLFGIVPLNFNVRGATPLAVNLTGTDAARINWFGSPLYARYDRRGHLVGLDGSQTTVKVRVDRVAGMNLDALARLWAAHDQEAGPAGPPSTRDTARATVGRAHLWVDYGRPSLRGRDVWVNGVLGDTIWRTGANAATQLSTDADIVVGGTPVPAGTYTLWTWVSGSSYHLIVNKQFGQWGTEYHADRDLARIPLRDSVVSPSVERFTVGLAPADGAATVLTLVWGTRQLSVPITAK